MKRTVTIHRARELDRAMYLLQRGRISYGRWVETLQAWVNNEDVSCFDFGDAESIPERVLSYLDRCEKTGTPSCVAQATGLDVRQVQFALSRLARSGRILRISHGTYQRKPAIRHTVHAR